MGGQRVTRKLLSTAALVLLLGAAGCAGAPESGNRDGIDSSGSVGGSDGGRVSVTAQDQRVITALGEIAARDAHPEGRAEQVECWAPSQSPIPSGSEEGAAPDEVAGEAPDREGDVIDPASAGAFRVLCRVHFLQQNTQRYRDVVCIGDVNEDPVSEYCYQWAYYADAPKFEDQPAFPADLD